MSACRSELDAVGDERPPLPAHAGRSAEPDLSGLADPGPHRAEIAAARSHPPRPWSQAGTADDAVDGECTSGGRRIDVAGGVPCSRRERVTAVSESGQDPWRDARSECAVVDRALERGRVARGREREPWR